MLTNRFRLLTGLLAAALALAACGRTAPTPTLLPPTATPTVATPAPTAASTTTLASGLRFPRNLRFGPDGALYVAEAGRGGDTETMGTCADFTSPFAPYRTGQTARVVRLAPGGTLDVVADGLPSARHRYGDALGVNDIAFLGDDLYALLMGGGCSRGFADFPTSVLRVNADGTVAVVADLGAFYAANPTAAAPEDDWEPEGSAYSMVAHDGKLYVLNANHASLDEVSPDGRIRRVADLSASAGHVTPTALTFHDGAFYVGALGKYPITLGTAHVYRVTPDGAVTVFADGLTAVLGLAFADDGTLYVLETSVVDNQYPQPATGRIVRRSPGGELTVVAAGLTFPTGLTLGPDGGLYVTVFGYGEDPAAGAVVRVDPTGTG